MPKSSAPERAHVSDLELNVGYQSPFLVPDEGAGGEKIALLDEPLIVIHEAPLSSWEDIRTLVTGETRWDNNFVTVRRASRSLLDPKGADKPLLFIGAGAEGEALRQLTHLVDRFGWRVAVVKLGGLCFRDTLEKIAAATGGVIFDNNFGYTLADLIQPSFICRLLGKAVKVKVERLQTMIFGGGGRPLSAEHGARSVITDAGSGTPSSASMPRGVADSAVLNAHEPEMETKAILTPEITIVSNKPGGGGRTLDATVAEMKYQLETGAITADCLGKMTQRKLAVRFKVSRQTATAARRKFEKA